MRLSRIAGSALSFWCFLGSLAGQQVPEALKIEPYTVKTFAGREIPAELLTLSVPRSNAANPRFKISFVRLRSNAPAPKAPIVFLAGGPGIPGSVMARVPPYATLFERLRVISDVILVDARGFGPSANGFTCTADPVLPDDLLANAARFRETLATLAKGCSEQWRKDGLDPNEFGTRAVVSDLEELRKAIRAEKLSLLGFSYGTEVALRYSQAYPDHAERLVLASTRGPDLLLKAPSTWDFDLLRVSEALRKSDPSTPPGPTLAELAAHALESLDKNPITIRVTHQKSGQAHDLKVGRIAVEALLRNSLPDERGFGRTLDMLRKFQTGDVSAFTAAINAFYNSLGGTAANGLAVDCGSGWSAHRRLQAEAESRDAVFRNVNLQWDPSICAALGVTPITPAPLKWTRVPALFITGTLDPNGPVFQAEQVRRAFAASNHVIVEGGWHETLPITAVQDVIVKFFAGEAVADQQIAARP